MGILKKGKKYQIKVTTLMKSHIDKGRAEFRYSELKYAMRFWWRAINISRSAERLHILETIIFGGTKSSSPIAFKPLKENKGYKAFIKEQDRNSQKDLNNLPVGTEIEFEVIQKRDGVDLKIYEDLIEIVAYLGGIGQDCKKGYGTFQIVNHYPYNSIKELANRIRELIQEINALTRKVEQELIAPTENTSEILERRLQLIQETIIKDNSDTVTDEYEYTIIDRIEIRPYKIKGNCIEKIETKEKVDSISYYRLNNKGEGVELLISFKAIKN